MADVKVALEELREELESGSLAISKPKAGKRATRPAGWLAFGALASVLLGLVPGAYFARRFFGSHPPSFQRLTFRRGDVTSARFAPGGTVVYSAEWGGAPSTLFSAQPGNREARPLGLPSGRLLAISPTGEMAVLLGGRPRGTLARVSFNGGAPRGILENVSGAHWGPGGGSLALGRA